MEGSDDDWGVGFMQESTENTDKLLGKLPLIFTERAAQKAKRLLEEEENAEQNLRVYVTGGGCAGFSYGFKFDPDAQDNDTQIETEGVVLVVDPLSVQYLTGSTVDYTEGLMGARFVVDNPNATTTCGCGSSFSI